MLNRSRLKVLGTLATLGIVFYFVEKSGQDIAWQQALETVQRIGFFTAFIALFWILLQSLSQMLRLWCLFPREARLSFITIAKAFSVGQFLNSFLPARAGDIAKVVILTQSGGPAISHNTGVIIADKIIDLMSLGLMVVLAGSLKHVRGSGFLAKTIIPLVVFLVLLALYLILRKRLKFLRRFDEGFRCLSHPKKTFFALCWSTGSWAFEAMAITTLSHSVGVDLAFSAACYCLFLLNVAIAIPVSFANLGTFEASLVVGLTNFGMGTPEAIATAGVHHVLQWTGISIWAAVTSLMNRLCI